MKKFGKKLVAMTLAGAMALAPMTAFAADTTQAPATGNANGSGSVEGWVDTDVFCVVLPTTTGNEFNFTLDPQGLITKTNGAAYSGKTFDASAKGLYFENVAGTPANDYSGTSDKLKVINKSTGDVDVSLEATITGLDGITLSDTDAFADTASSIYLKAVCGSDDGVLTENGVTVGDSITALPNAYKFNHDGSKYEYIIDTSVAANDDAFNNIEFYLEGACNQTDGVDWSALTAAAPTVNLVWTVDKHNDTPESDGTTPIVITYTGVAPTAGSISIKQPSGTSWTPAASSYTDGSFTIDDSAKTLTIAPSWLAYNKTSRGTGTYVMTINGAQYSFIIK